MHEKDFHMIQLRRPVMFLAAMAMLVLLLMACGGESDDETADLSPSDDRPTLPAESAERTIDDNAELDADGDGIFNASEFRQAVRSAFPGYRWPPNYTPTADAILGYFSGGRSMEGNGFKLGVEHT